MARKPSVTPPYTEIVSGRLRGLGLWPVILVIEISSQSAFEAIVYSKTSPESFDKIAFHTLDSNFVPGKYPLIGYGLYGNEKGARWERRKWEDLLREKHYRTVKQRARQIYLDTMKLVEEPSKVGRTDDIKRNDFDLEAGEKAIKETLAARVFRKLNLLPFA